MNSTEDSIPDLHEGDIFYTRNQGKYQLYKLLKSDEEPGAFHVLAYEPLDELPGKYGTENLPVSIYHMPVYAESFTGATFLTNIPVTDDELIGYYEYLKRLEENYEQRAAKATEYYHEAYVLTDQGNMEAAIEKYSLAIELVPDFFEAIDNRAFCKMDLGRWQEAIRDFELSLKVNPDSILAEFSIGECYYRLGNYAEAKNQFARCIKLDPSHDISREFMLKSEELMKHN